MRRQRAWDGIGVWSSHPVENPARKNLRSFGEILALMHWDERFAKAFRRAHREYIKAGSPPIPWGATDYRKHIPSNAPSLPPLSS